MLGNICTAITLKIKIPLPLAFCHVNKMSQKLRKWKCRRSKNILTWLENRETPVHVTKHDFALLLGVPPEGADVGHEAVSVSVHGHAAVRPGDGPDEQRAPAGSKGHGLARVPAPAQGGRRPWNRGDVVTAESPTRTAIQQHLLCELYNTQKSMFITYKHVTFWLGNGILN